MKLSSKEKAIIIYVFNQFGAVEGLKSLVDILNKKLNLKDEFIVSCIGILIQLNSNGDPEQQKNILTLIDIYLRTTYGIEKDVEVCA